jgi:hypothetical protein
MQFKRRRPEFSAVIEPNFHGFREPVQSSAARNRLQANTRNNCLVSDQCHDLGNRSSIETSKNIYPFLCGSLRACKRPPPLPHRDCVPLLGRFAPVDRFHTELHAYPNLERERIHFIAIACFLNTSTNVIYIFGNRYCYGNIENTK